MRQFDLNATLRCCIAACLVLLGTVVGVVAASNARAAEGAAEPLPVQEVAPGIFVYQAPYQLAAPINGGAIGNAGFIVGREAVAVVDTGGSAKVGARLLAAVRARTALPIRFVINTHFHPDHVLGDAAFVGLGAKFVGHKNLATALAARAAVYLEANKRLIGEADFAGTTVVPPDVAVDGTMTVDLGDRVLELEAHPTAHTNADLTVFDRATRTWWLADLLFVRHVPALDGSLRGWLAVMDKAKQRACDRVVPGHGPASVAWPAALAPQERYLARMRDEIRAKIRDGVSLAEAARSSGMREKDAWDLFEDFNARNATAAYHELEWE